MSSPSDELIASLFSTADGLFSPHSCDVSPFPTLSPPFSMISAASGLLPTSLDDLLDVFPLVALIESSRCTTIGELALGITLLGFALLDLLLLRILWLVVAPVRGSAPSHAPLVEQRSLRHCAQVPPVMPSRLRRKLASLTTSSCAIEITSCFPTGYGVVGLVAGQMRGLDVELVRRFVVPFSFFFTFFPMFAQIFLLLSFQRLLVTRCLLPTEIATARVP